MLGVVVVLHTLDEADGQATGNRLYAGTCRVRRCTRGRRSELPSPRPHPSPFHEHPPVHNPLSPSCSFSHKRVPKPSSSLHAGATVLVLGSGLPAKRQAFVHRQIEVNLSTEME